jgi:D-ribose pyranase
MLLHGILNPQINALLAHVRHTNMLVIADRGFPFFPYVETIDISLVDGIPTVMDVFKAIKENFEISEIYMAEEFQNVNKPETIQAITKATQPVPIHFEPHIEFKKKVPSAIGLIRTGDSTQYANMILVSGPFHK